MATNNNIDIYWEGVMHVPKDQSEINILSLNLFEPFFILRIGLYEKKFAESSKDKILNPT